MPVNRVSSASARSARSSNPVLRVGAHGASVRVLQSLLRKRGYSIAVDGAFGPKTQAAVLAFQRARGLSVDGIVGPQTWGALRGAAATGPSRSRGGSSAGPGIAATGYRNGRRVGIRIAPVGNGRYLSTRCAGAYKDMLAAARRAGIWLGTTSGYRTYAQQAALYRRYGAGRAARPGYSNHQLGLSADISGIGGYNSRAYRWLRANAARFGFRNDVRGEPWHWTYVR